MVGKIQFHPAHLFNMPLDTFTFFPDRILLAGTSEDSIGEEFPENGRRESPEPGHSPIQAEVTGTHGTHDNGTGKRAGPPQEEPIAAHVLPHLSSRHGS